ncbi:MAG: hypothetical protein JWN94_1755 [Betaproteobacteria bacterium]|nr:hypothetical protein [Betaproteobacteria bacterium]
MKYVSFMSRALVLALSLTAGQALANISYTFSGVTFSDGGTLTGNFTTNDAISSLLNYNITTSPGAGGLGFNYTPATSNSTSTSLPSILVLSTTALDNILQVTFTSLTATGSPITINTFASFEQHLNARRDITAGSAVVAAVPEPENYAMMLAGLGWLGFIARRRKQSAA